MKVQHGQGSIAVWGGVIVLSLTLFGCGKQQNRNAIHEFQDTQIVNGAEVRASDPLGRSVVAIVSQQDQTQALCTGTLLSDDTVLTAAHCVDNQPEKLTIVFSNELKNISSGNAREASSYIQNPAWGGGSSDGRGDLALIHFDGGLSGGFSTVKLAPPTMDIDTGLKILVMGYGVTDGTSSEGAGVLRETTSSVLQAASATEYVTDGRQSGVCFGDSGGPAFSRLNGEIVQWGVASSVSSHDCNQVSVHTSVVPYRAWITSAMGKLRKGS